MISKTLKLTAIASAITVAIPSYAVELEEIVVTARKKEESQQVVPVAVTALSGQAIKQEAVQNVLDLASSTPGLM